MGPNKSSTRTLPTSQQILHIKENISVSFHKLDRFFASLIFLQVFILLAFLSFNPFTSKYAFFAGLGIVFPAIYLAVFHSGKTLTRQVIAVTQMVIASLMFYLLDQYVLVNLHLLFSLAVLTIYKDWRIFVSTIIIISFEYFAQFFSINPVFQSQETKSTVENWLLILNAALIFGLWMYESKQKLKIELTDKLNRSEERFYNFVDTVDDLIYKTDEKGYFTFVNPSFIELMGYNLEENKNLRYVDVIAPHYRK